MKILMLAPEPFFEPRGTPISVYQRLLGLSQLGYEVDLVTYHLGAPIDVPRVTVHRTARFPFIRAVRSGPSWQKLVLDLLLFVKALSLLLKNSYEVVHAHEEAAVLASILARAFRTKHIYDMHSSLPQQLKSFSFWGSPLFAGVSQVLESWTIRWSDAVITIAPDLAQRVREIEKDSHCVVIENLPVQSSVGQRDGDSGALLRGRINLNGRFPVVYTGNLQRYQGIDLLIQSAKLVTTRHPEVIFVLVGGKEQEIRHWQAIVRESGLDECVRFVGSVPIDQLPSYLELAEVLVSPRTEGMSVPLKIYSYLYSAKPIVATAIPAHTLVLDGDSALLVAPTKEALAEGIGSMVASPELRLRLGSGGRRLAERNYDHESYLVKLDQVYRMFQPGLPPLVTPPDAVLH